MNYNVYYESLEQALYYVKKDIVKVNPENKVNLIRLKKQNINKNGFSSDYSKKISNILLRKNPDLIISTEIDSVEYPLMIVEFSTAVFTKDHELQRADNLMIPINNKCIYVKVSPINKKTGGHGGDDKFNYLEPYSLIYKTFNEFTFHIDWGVNDENSKILKRHDKYKSIPPNSNHLYELFKEIEKSIKTDGIINWKQKFNKNIEQNILFKEWCENIKKIPSYEDIRDFNSPRTYFSKYDNTINKNDVFTLKFNRMTHAMDPERGMLAYYSTFHCDNSITVKSKIIFDIKKDAWYKDKAKTTHYIKDKIEKIDELSRENLIDFFIKGLVRYNGNQLYEIVTNSSDRVIDISDFVDNNYNRINNSLRVIFDYSSFLEISNGDNTSVILSWKPNKNNFDLSRLKDLTNYKKRESIEEDDVCYITIHDMFASNNIETINVSYPGAQSDTAILPNPDKGRNQERVYIDSIGKKNNILIFQENKGVFNKKDIKDDIQKIIKFKHNNNYIKSAVKFKNENNLKTTELIIGVGFAESKAGLNDLNDVGLENVDYFLIIDKKRENWKIFSNTDQDIFKRKSGRINFPETFEVSKRIEA